MSFIRKMQEPKTLPAFKGGEDSKTFFILKGHGDYTQDGKHIQVGPGNIDFI